MQEIKLENWYKVDFIEEAVDTAIRVSRYKLSADYDENGVLQSFKVVSKIEKYKVIKNGDINNIFVSVPREYRNVCAICRKPFGPGEVYTHFQTDLSIPSMSESKYKYDAWYKAHLYCLYHYFDSQSHVETVSQMSLASIALQSLRETGGFILRLGGICLVGALVIQYWVEKWSDFPILWTEYMSNYILIKMINFFEFMRRL